MSSHMSDLHPTRRIANIWSRGNKTSAKAVEVLGRVSWAGYQIRLISENCSNGGGSAGLRGTRLMHFGKS